jgi:threonine/homoserine/homoserine lactone efflux protein
MAAIKLAGGSYLIFLGIKGLSAKPHQKTEENFGQALKTDSTFQLVSTGFFCNALNPKAPVYFLSLFTVVLSPEIPLPNLAAYGVWIMLLQMFWFTTLTCFLTNTVIRGQLIRLGHWIDRVFGAAMLTLGLQVLNSSR